MSAVEVALRYAARGWPVFPCKSSGRQRKHPYTHHGLKDASADPNQIKSWWRAHPDALIGIPTGEPIGLVVLDVERLQVSQNISLMTLEQRDQLALALIEDLKAIAADARVIEGQAVEVKSNATDQE